MDIRDLIQFAPEDCKPTIITRESILEEGAKRLGKTVEEMTDEEKKKEFDNYAAVCMLDTDFS